MVNSEFSSACACLCDEAAVALKFLKMSAKYQERWVTSLTYLKVLLCDFFICIHCFVPQPVNIFLCIGLWTIFQTKSKGCVVVCPKT